jgi:16S rRNA (uracil1498-N3)-methyltransferase
MRRFYTPKENFQADKAILKLEETRHLRDVLRLREGEEIQVFDGEGREFLGAIKKISKSETLLEIIREITPSALESDLDLTLAIALLKGEKFDLVVQKSVELGVMRIIPLNTKRADVKFTGGEKKLERWRKIALEAAKQCGRAKLLQIEKPIDFKEFVEAESGTRILFAERGGASFSEIKTAEQIIAAVGAEGGWEDAEIEMAREKGFQIITLGGRILRAETAAISVTAILQHSFGDLR